MGQAPVAQARTGGGHASECTRERCDAAGAALVQRPECHRAMAGSDCTNAYRAEGWQARQARVGRIARGYSAALTGMQLQNRLRSPYTLSTRPTLAQYLLLRRAATG